jgi:hypothetical protein
MSHAELLVVVDPTGGVSDDLTPPAMTGISGRVVWALFGVMGGRAERERREWRRHSLTGVTVGSVKPIPELTLPPYSENRKKQTPRC